MRILLLEKVFRIQSLFRPLSLVMFSPAWPYDGNLWRLLYFSSVERGEHRPLGRSFPRKRVAAASMIHALRDERGQYTSFASPAKSTPPSGTLGVTQNNIMWVPGGRRQVGFSRCPIAPPRQTADRGCCRQALLVWWASRYDRFIGGWCPGRWPAECSSGLTPLCDSDRRNCRWL